MHSTAFHYCNNIGNKQPVRKKCLFALISEVLVHGWLALFFKDIWQHITSWQDICGSVKSFYGKQEVKKETGSSWSLHSPSSGAPKMTSLLCTKPIT